MLNKTKKLLTAATLAFSLGTVAIVIPTLGHADIYQVDRDDPRMNKAMRDARASLDRILAKTMSARGFTAQGFIIKVAVPTFNDTSYEYIWVEKVSANGAGWKGKLANQPVNFAGRLGGPIRFNKTQVVDWSYSAAGKRFGEYTTRAILPRLSKSEQSRIKANLSKNPIPKGW
jgi:uncharacterized protein YegJ (DUF2314 family)